MLFLVTRASGYHDSQPCDGAFRHRYIRIDTRDVDDPSKLQSMNPKHWFADGINHRVVDGKITRDLFYTEWAVIIDDILKFVDTYGDIVISKIQGSELYKITIYDDYLE